jgi:hypothetical protein
MIRSSKATLFAALTLSFSVCAIADPLVVTGLDPTAANALAMAQALAGAGITVTSASITGNSSAVTGAFQQGSFTGGTGIIPFDAGILLTSGNALSAPGPNTSASQSFAWGTAGDAQLNTLAGGTTNDANILTFTFHKTDPNAPDVVSFQYVFASEEYNEFVGTQFNDVFGFFLNGSNIALVPGTATPVAINTVNCASNSAFYNSNDSYNPSSGGCNGTFTTLNTQYDGIAGGIGSLALFATGNLVAGDNTIKLAIADTGDAIYDSAVFLSAGSFVNAPPPSVPEPSSILLLGGALSLVAFKARKRFI